MPREFVRGSDVDFTEILASLIWVRRLCAEHHFQKIAFIGNFCTSRHYGLSKSDGAEIVEQRARREPTVRTRNRGARL